MLGLRSGLFLSIAVFWCYSFTQPSHAQTSGLAEKESEVVRGTVLNSVTHEPVGRALVYSPDNRFATLTDARGRFEFKLRSNESAKKNGMASPEIDARTISAPSRPSALMARKPGFLPADNF